METREKCLKKHKTIAHACFVQSSWRQGWTGIRKSFYKRFVWGRMDEKMDRRKKDG